MERGINRDGVRVWSRRDTTKGIRACCLDLFQIMGPSGSKKRKRDDEGEDGRISFKLSALPENQPGPVLGEFTPRLVIGGGG